jgi:hypothetical protein
MTQMLLATAFTAQELLGETISAAVSRADMRRVRQTVRAVILLKPAASFMCDHFCKIFVG